MGFIVHFNLSDFAIYRPPQGTDLNGYLGVWLARLPVYGDAATWKLAESLCDRVSDRIAKPRGYCSYIQSLCYETSWIIAVKLSMTRLSTVHWSCVYINIKHLICDHLVQLGVNLEGIILPPQVKWHSITICSLGSEECWSTNVFVTCLRNVFNDFFKILKFGFGFCFHHN